MVDWEKSWRGNGVAAAVLFLAAEGLYGKPAKVGASPDGLVPFYDGDRTRILIATVVFGFAILSLLWLAVVSTFLVRRYSAATTPDRAAVAGGVGR